jgi:hypothetical protein
VNRIIVALREEIRMDETQEKSDSKEKTGNAIKELDLLHRLFINHGDYGGHSGQWGRGMTSSWGMEGDGRPTTERTGRLLAGDLTTTHTRLSVYVLRR